ncbi:iron-siderophore ABC transporter substrate-binding protein [Microbacterium betulae]|uniref:Iron-siderophore ABC transporter substrate-binding protein n=1 Tax=Microbacterium betulae TaxID=2981139 RepID=A0AA97FFE0_9MICO|nr:iron-siderophore ABC transporter substrate-binding protein [Microbacterium sp. AB]WOF21588.1 iron-siderophore ABC transporter substrate-binding protein [Microbacterium sp. AB]
MHSKRVLAFAATIAAAAALTACSPSAEEPAATADGGSADDAAFPVTVQHALGETTIDSAPENVTTIGWGNQDVALALGVAPVGVSDQTWSFDATEGAGLYEWTTQAYEELGAAEPTVFDETDGLDFEAIADTAPDVILAAYSGLTEDEYATLSEIAPTVAYPGIPWGTTWREAIELDSQALGLAAEGEDLVADLDAQLAEAVAAAPDLEGKSFAFISATASDLSSIYVYTPIDPRVGFLTDLGLEVPESVATLGEENEGQFYGVVSAENIDLLSDVDVLVSYGDDSLTDALQADALLSTLPSVQNGAVVTLGIGEGLSAAATQTALSIPWSIDDYVAALEDAASKVQ